MGTEARWQDVPGLVVALYSKHAAQAFAAACKHADDRHAAYLDPATGRTDAVPWSDSWLLVKAAEGEAFLKAPADAFSAIQKPLGGPHPLAASIVGGLLGSGLGYGGGYLAEKMAPEGSVEKGRLRKSMAVLGGAAGAVPGVAWAGVNAANPAQTGGHPWTSQWPFKAAQLVKAAMGDSGAFYMPTIPVDAFNRVLWNDVNAQPSPFGTKSPWGDNQQPLGTPGPAAAAVSGLVAGAGAATGSTHVSPYHVALAAGVAGGKGWAAGALAGGVLGALAGLSPAAQQSLRSAGLWSGIVSGVANTVFGGG